MSGQENFWGENGVRLVPESPAKARARRGHPESSVDGARAVEGRLARIYLAIEDDLERRSTPATAREIGRATGEEAWKRMRELERAGRVREIGRRKCRVTGVRTTTWSLKR